MLWTLPVPIIHQKFFLAYANLKINIVFDFLTTEYFLNLACVKFKPITHIIAKFPNYTTLAWVRFELKIPIRINLRTTVRIGRGNLLLVMNNVVLL